MNRTLLMLCLCAGLLITACKQKDNQTPANNSAALTQDSTENTTTSPKLETADSKKTTVQFDAMTHDFGKIIQGEKVTHRFKFKNTGNNPLIIKDVKPSCGCTTPDWTKDAVMPGNSGFIEVQFDSEGKKGMQNKSVTVTANTDSVIILNFKGEVIEKK
ncbi:MAG: DUF1573 domain-containing protein [Bacteroidia bacterium]|nr:DUF1573 domain-containing protein [Bacteroidia bacterium]